MKTQTASQGKEQQGEEDGRCSVHRRTLMHTHRLSRTSAIPLQESFLCFVKPLRPHDSQCVTGEELVADGPEMNQFPSHAGHGHTSTHATHAHTHENETNANTHTFFFFFFFSEPTITHNDRLLK